MLYTPSLGVSLRTSLKLCVQICKSLAHSKHGLFCFYGFFLHNACKRLLYPKTQPVVLVTFFREIASNLFWYQNILKLTSIQNFSPIGYWVLKQLLYFCKTNRQGSGLQPWPTHRAMGPTYRVLKSKYLSINKWATLSHILKYQKSTLSQWNVISCVHENVHILSPILYNKILQLNKQLPGYNKTITY